MSAEGKKLDQKFTYHFSKFFIQETAIEMRLNHSQLVEGKIVPCSSLKRVYHQLLDYIV
jgi:hypothetical protein